MVIRRDNLVNEQTFSQAVKACVSPINVWQSSRTLGASGKMNSRISALLAKQPLEILFEGMILCQRQRLFPGIAGIV